MCKAFCHSFCNLVISTLIMRIFVHYIIVSEPESEEDKERKYLKNKMKEEYYFSIQEEGLWSI